MGYSKLGCKIIRSSNNSERRTKKIEIITPHIVLTKPVEKIKVKVKVKNNERDTD